MVAMTWGWNQRESARTLWRHAPSGWRNNPSKYQRETYLVQDRTFTVEYRVVGTKSFDVRVNGSRGHNVTLVGFISHKNYDEILVNVDGLQQRYLVADSSSESRTVEDDYHVPKEIYVHNSRWGTLSVTKLPRFPLVREQEADASAVSPSRGNDDQPTQEGVSVYGAHMPGKVVKVAVKAGDEVKPGDLLLVMEAMKMESNINCSQRGVIHKVHIKAGDVVNVKARLVEVLQK